VFTNPGGIPIMLRGVTTEDDEHSIDISIMVADDKPFLEDCMKNEVAALQEDSFFVLHEYILEEEDIETIRTLLNSVWLWRVCPCSQYMIKQPDQDMCYMCSMTNSTVEESFCPICHDSQCHPRWMMRTACCKQPMHKICYQTWKSKADTCAICRAQDSA
jgi:hypothetical protein